MAWLLLAAQCMTALPHTRAALDTYLLDWPRECVKQMDRGATLHLPVNVGEHIQLHWKKLYNM